MQGMEQALLPLSSVESGTAGEPLADERRAEKIVYPGRGCIVAHTSERSENYGKESAAHVDAPLKVLIVLISSVRLLQMLADFKLKLTLQPTPMGSNRSKTRWYSCRCAQAYTQPPPDAFYLN